MNTLSSKVINRLTLYHCLLKYTMKDRKFVSSFEIADLLHLDDSQVRKDIALCNVLGSKKQGYSVQNLKQTIEQKLGFANRKKVFIIGAGSLGTALMNYADFEDYGIDILALLDNDKNKIGQEINSRKIQPLDKLKRLVSELKGQSIILAVPPANAQEVVDYAVSCGIRFIWNFTPAILKVSNDITVYYENIIGSFMQMRNQPLANKKSSKP